MNYYPLFRVSSWNNGMRCMSLYILYEFVIWPACFVGHSCPGGICPECGPLSTTGSITTTLGTLLMTDILQMFSPVYFSVEVCLVSLFPHYVITRRDPCVRVCAPLPLASPSRENIIEQGVTRLSSSNKWGTFELTHGSACIIGWYSGLLDSLIPPYVAQFIIGCIIGRIHYGLQVVFCFRHFTAYHYHHNSRVLTCVENIK